MTERMSAVSKVNMVIISGKIDTPEKVEWYMFIRGTFLLTILTDYNQGRPCYNAYCGVHFKWDISRGITSRTGPSKSNLVIQSATVKQMRRAYLWILWAKFHMKGSERPAFGPNGLKKDDFARSF